METQKNFIIFIIILAGIFFRFNQINYEDFWIDEIFSFWIADPNIYFLETIKRHNSIEQIPIFFNLILKFFYSVFGYDVKIGRYFIAILSSLSVICCFILSQEFKNKDFKLIFIFLISFNIFLIKYSNELRPYSLIVLLFILSLLFFFRYLNNPDYFFNFLFFTLFITLLIFSHPFNFIFLFAIIFFILFNFILKKRIFKRLNWSILVTIIFSIIYYTIYFKNLNELTSWVPELELKFFTNFFFSKFFGSRLLGLIHLCILLFLIFRYRSILINSDKFLILSTVIFLTYFLPILFSLIFKNILIDRYIIFVIIPVLLLTTNFIYLIRRKILKNFLIWLLVLLTIANFATENSFKQLYKDTDKSKPDFSSVLSKINDSSVKNIIIKKSETSILNKVKFYHKVDESLNLYINKYIEFHNYNLVVFDQSQLNKYKNEQIWILCYIDLDLTNCKIPINEDQFIVNKNLNFNKLNLKLISYK